ncbi:RNA polymerase recycling motor HelD [Peptoclostridium acidaminophilum]|nr:RNA polymerase recycling motor HelD [Peptoclostridium acidaminophilum]
MKNHPEYFEEVERLNETLLYVENTISAAEQNKDAYREEIKDAYINLDYLDSSQSYASILVNTRLLDALERNYDGLQRARKKPYFARLDFKQDENGRTDKFYIGKTSLFKAEWEIPMIVDWRSPIASVYYDGELGSVSYQSATETITGELLLKRQYTLENGTLEGIMDIDITTTDAFLQASLEGNKDNRLKDIVSTIQSEQNAIIRSDIHKPLIVQGVAGSGKTTIALHRIAYLIYNHEKDFIPENFMIMAPNQLFLNYISEVLPELGADRVKQTTYVDFMHEVIGKKYRLTDSDEKLISIINGAVTKDESDSHELLKKASRFKGSMRFKNVIERYIRDIELNFVPDEDVTVEGHTLMTSKEIKKLFISQYRYLPLYKRIAEIKKNLSNTLKRDKIRILEEIEQFYDKQIEYLRYNEAQSEERRKKIVNLIDARDNAMESLKKNSRNIISKYISKFPKKDLLDYYKDLLTNSETLVKYGNGKLSSEFAEYVSEHSTSIFSKKQMELEDLAGIAYMKHRVFGFDDKLDIRYVVIDEAQDFSHFQFYALKEILNTKLFTILGDLSQGIHAHRGINNWNFILNNIFDPQESQYLELAQSYRTTIEIMDLANEVIKMCPIDGLLLAQPVVRHGEKPQAFKFDSDGKIIDALQNNVEQLKSDGYSSIAVIGKTLDECKKIQKCLAKNKNIETKLLGEKADYSENNVVIVPSYLAKGLEFDAVIIVTLEDAYSQDELDIKLLYVAMTRALHRLCILCKNNTIPAIEKTGILTSGSGNAAV